MPIPSRKNRNLSKVDCCRPGHVEAGGSSTSGIELDVIGSSCVGFSGVSGASKGASIVDIKRKEGSSFGIMARGDGQSLVSFNFEPCCVYGQVLGKNGSSFEEYAKATKCSSTVSKTAVSLKCDAYLLSEDQKALE